MYSADVAKSFTPPLVDQSVREPKVGGYVRLTAAQMKCEGATKLLGGSKGQEDFYGTDWREAVNDLFNFIHTSDLDEGPVGWIVLLTHIVAGLCWVTGTYSRTI